MDKPSARQRATATKVWCEECGAFCGIIIGDTCPTPYDDCCKLSVATVYEAIVSERNRKATHKYDIGGECNCARTTVYQGAREDDAGPGYEIAIRNLEEAGTT